jgi:hypothetical protein
MRQIQETERCIQGRSDGKIPFGRPGHSWEHNIKMDNVEVGWIGMDWIDLAYDRDRWHALVNAIMILQVP